MLELPEAVVLAGQISETVAGRRIVKAAANESPHRFAWYTGDPANYGRRLAGKTVGAAEAYGNHVETRVGDLLLVTSANLRLHAAGAKLPANRQLRLDFADKSALTGHVQMWGVFLCLADGQDAGIKDYAVSKAKPSALSREFDERYFRGLLDDEARAMSAKAFLATEQRIPGLGNGVLQDILWTARIHPKRKMATLSAGEIRALYESVKLLMAEMTRLGGRDSEKDLFGRPGGYETILGAKKAGKPCPACGNAITKEAYLGGSIYYCPTCQPAP
jgi:formamidopyrimidine-DNA glycosylase